MKKKLLLVCSILAAFSLGIVTMSFIRTHDDDSTKKPLNLGVFSVSLNVKDLQVSKQFYEKLGFKKMGGSEAAHYLIMKNGTTIIGIFQGMFQGNILTFNPGWDVNAKNVKKFDDVRYIQKRLKSEGIALLSEADTTTTGPASILFTDPDGNVLLVDQHR